METGGFLPTIFRPFESGEYKIRHRRGTVMMVAAPAGHMKTALTLYWVARLNEPALYFSADSEEFEMRDRAAAMISGHTQDQVSANPSAYAEALEHLPFRVVYEDAPTYQDLALEVAAYAECYGAFPKHIVIDNLMNLVGETDNEWSGMRDSTKAIHRLARVTGAALWVLHHMGETKEDQSYPQPRKALQGKVSQLAKVILSLAYDDAGELKVSPVKNRFGKASPSGQGYVTIYVTPERMQFFNSRFDQQSGRPA